MRIPLNSLGLDPERSTPSLEPPTAAAAKNNTAAPLQPAPHHRAARRKSRDQNTHKKGNTAYWGKEKIVHITLLDFL